MNHAAEVSKRYNHSAKGKARNAKYRKTAKRKAAQAKYKKTEKGRAVDSRWFSKPEILERHLWQQRSLRKQRRIDSNAI